MADLAKRVTERIRAVRCSQPNCRSESQDTLEVVVFGDIATEKQGFMCSSCFLEDSIIPKLKKVECNVLPIRKFMKKLTEAYSAYKQLKDSQNWQPNINERLRKEIKQILTVNEAEMNKRIAEVLLVVQKEVENAISDARINNTDRDFEKVLEFMEANRPVEVRDSLISLSTRIVKLNNDYTYTGEELVKQGNERISERVNAIVKVAEECILKLIELQTKQLQSL